jgi:hypothetical protein
MTTPTFTPSDIVKFAAAKDAVNISAAFDQLVGQKIVDAISARKQTVASSMFGQEVEAEAEEEVQASAEEQGSEEASDEVDSTVGSQEQSEQETEESNEDAEVTN